MTIIRIVILCILIAANISCFDDPPDKPMENEHDASQQSGNISSNIDADGGEIVISATGTAADGIVIKISPDTFRAEITINLTIDESPVVFEAGSPSGVVVSLSAESSEEFQKPVEITIPLDPSMADKMPVPYEVEDDGSLKLLDLINYDQEAGEAVFVIMRTLSFTWAYIE